MRHLLMELSSIHTSIWIYNASLALFDAINELPYIHRLHNLVLVVAVAVLGAVVPLSFVVFFRGV